MVYLRHAQKKQVLLPITSAQRQTLETWIRAHNTPQSIAIRRQDHSSGSGRFIQCSRSPRKAECYSSYCDSFGVNDSWRVGLEAITTILPGRWSSGNLLLRRRLQRIVEATTQTKRRLPPTGALAVWPKRKGSVRPPVQAYMERPWLTTASHSALQNFQLIATLLKSSPMWLDCI